MAWDHAAVIIIGYLLGSIPFAVIITRLRGVNIRERGSGNPGALTVWREAGPAFGAIALIADVGKGVLAIYVAKWLGLDFNTDPLWMSLAGFAAVAGHNWPVFLKFRGGKGAATIMGVLLALMPVQFAIGFGIAVLVVIPTSNIRLGIIGLALIPLVSWLFGRPAQYIYYPLGLVVFLAGYTAIGLKGEAARAGGRKGALVDREYHFWQTRKNG